MEITQTRPLSIVILQDGSRLFAETTKEQIAIDAQKNSFLKIQWQMISTVTGNIRTIRDSNDAEYYEFFVLDHLPPAIMERMSDTLARIHESKQDVTLSAIISRQKRYEEELEYTRGITPQDKENRRKQIIRMNNLLVEKGVMTHEDADRITKNILNQK